MRVKDTLKENDIGVTLVSWFIWGSDLLTWSIGILKGNKVANILLSAYSFFKLQNQE
jgi:hypothetical protein